MPRRPTAVAFDVNETLFSMDRLSDAFEEAGLPGHTIDLWFARLLQTGHSLAATDSYAAFPDLAHLLLQRLLRSFGLDSSDEAVDEVLSAFEELEAHEDVEPAFERLRDEGVRIATVTVGSADITSTLLEKNGLAGFVERCFDVEPVKLWKPRAEPYHYVADELGVEPSELALVAVHSWDIHGAKRAGLTTAYAARLEVERIEVFDEPDVSAQNLIEAVEGLLALSD